VISCATPEFTVKKSDTRFEETDGNLYMSENNRISTKSVGGGLHIDLKGVYINPFVEKNGGIKDLGLIIINKTDYDTSYGDGNQLGIIKSVVFRLPGGDLIRLEVKGHENINTSPVRYNPAGRYASYNKSEIGTMSISLGEFKKLAYAEHITCKVTGSKRSVVFEEDEIEDKFLPNLRYFYESYLK